MMRVRKIGMFIDQPVFLFTGTLAEAVNTPTPLTVHHTCGVFFHDYEWNVRELRDLVASLIRQGCVSMMFHGCRCREAEDVADNVFVEGGFVASIGGGPEDTLMTTSAEGETTTNAVVDLYVASFPSGGFTNSGFYILSFGSDAQNDELDELLGDPEMTIRSALSTMPRRPVLRSDDTTI